MATAADVAAYAAAQDDVVALAHRDLLRWWSTVDTTDARAAAAALVDFLPELVAMYGDVAADVAADWYDELRERAGAPGLFRALVAEPPPVEQVAATARWAAGPLFGEDGDPLARLAGSVQRLVQSTARESIARSAARDPSRPRWARVLRGRGCAWCRMLAGRGAVYRSAQTAGAGRAWHDHCKCVPTPVWEGQRLPYDADALEREYLAARERADGSSTRAVLAQMRQDLGVA